MKTKYKYIHFDEAVKGMGLGAIWECYNNKAGQFLGFIPKQKTWNQYVFEPHKKCVFNNQCLRDIADFLDQLNKGGQ